MHEVMGCRIVDLLHRRCELSGYCDGGERPLPCQRCIIHLRYRCDLMSIELRSCHEARGARPADSARLSPSQRRACIATPSTRSRRCASEPPSALTSPTPPRSCKAERRTRPLRAYQYPCQAPVVNYVSILQSGFQGSGG